VIDNIRRLESGQGLTDVVDIKRGY
jgi:hypothetical protein